MGFVSYQALFQDLCMRVVSLFSDAAKNYGIQIMTVGITSSVDEMEIMQISSDPRHRDKNYFLVPYFDQLSDIVERLAQEVCSFTVPIVETGCFAGFDLQRFYSRIQVAQEVCFFGHVFSVLTI